MPFGAAHTYVAYIRESIPQIVICRDILYCVIGSWLYCVQLHGMVCFGVMGEYESYRIDW